MRLYRIFILLALLLAVVSCQHIEQGTQTETVSTPPAAAQDTELQETGTEITVVSIRNTTPTDAAPRMWKNLSGKMRDIATFSATPSANM